MKAFILGAGLGTRLRPLTERRPKPLVPIYGKPLITFAFDHLIAHGITSFIVNTHHCPETYHVAFPGGEYRGCPLAFCHESVLLDTGGGIKNIEGFMGESPFVVYNGDILADFPLQAAIDSHLASRNIATLVLRSFGGPLHIQCQDGLVYDIRNTIGNACSTSFLFTGISILSPEIFRHIRAGDIVSIISIYLSLIRAKIPIGGIVVDEGLWCDLGNRDAYLGAHAMLRPGGHRLSYLAEPWPQVIEESADIAPSARVEGACSIGYAAQVGAGAILENCVLWENALVHPGSRLTRCIVRDGYEAKGMTLNSDF